MAIGETKAAVSDPALLRWLGNRIDMRAPRFVEARSPTAGGWSSETHIVTLGDGDATRRIVLRFAPGGPAMFPEYDLSRQVACMRALHSVADCPVPDILADDLKGTVLGRPFYVMNFVAGDIPSDDRPTLFEAGFLFDADPADQRRFHLAFLDTLVALHRFAPPAHLVRTLSRTGTGRTPLARELAWLRGVFDWGYGAAAQPVIENAFAWLDTNLPDDPNQALLWGDARPANVVVRDFRPAALLDWELASLGPPELDVFWLLEMNRMRSKGKLLPGFLPDPEACAHYEAHTRHVLRDSQWHIRFAATKVAVLMLRHLLVRVAHGDLPADHPVLTSNTATRRVQALIQGGSA
jgi:aminoglycoside phosphotransferase (APT) family kinase protein